MASSAPRYARAFAEVVRASRLDVPVTRRQLDDFAGTLAGSHELREILMSPSVEMGQKLKVLNAIAPRIGMCQQVRNFIAVIMEHHRLAEFGEILTAFAELADELAGATEATITSARPLTVEDRAELEEQVARLAGAQVRATYVEDPTLLGGAVVQIGSTIYDGSVKAQLQQLKQMLVNA